MDARTLAVPLHQDADGSLRVAGSRVTLETVLAAFEAGATPEEIGQRFPTLHLADVYAVIGYYLQHTQDMQQYLQRREREADHLQHEIEAYNDPMGLRARLLARREPIS